MKRIALNIFVLCCALLSCSPGGEEKPFEPYLQIRPEAITFGAEGGVEQVQVLANFDYEMIPNVDWLSTEKGEEFWVKVKAEASKVTSERKGEITIKSKRDNTSKILTVTQEAYVKPIDTDGWAEMPAKVEDANLEYCYHDKLPSNNKLRNYSFCFDKEKHCALWVAYPLHECYTSKAADRTDAWSYDPLVPAENQSNMSRSLGNGYDRGHQIASADRLASSHMNAQTFYYTNMTAQVGVGLNQSIWNNLENHIRSEYICSDTLYVVTGCVMTTEEDSQVQWVDNRNGGKVAVPKAYFKVLLRTKSGDTGQVVDSSNAMTIGFWYENRKYNYSTPRVDDVKSVGEIEQLTGLTFFPQISDHIKARKELESWGF